MGDGTKTPEQRTQRDRADVAEAFTKPAHEALGRGVSIDVFSVATGMGVSFPAFVTSFTDSYTCNWNSQNAAGRMDPIQTYQNTQRMISIDFDLIASSLPEAITNMVKCQTLVQMMYPTFRKDQKQIGASMEAPPYFKFKFANLASDLSGGASGKSLPAGQAAAVGGLFGTMAGVDYSPDFDVGVYFQGGDLFAKLVSLSLEITVLHNHPLGYRAGESEGSFKYFPYSIRNFEAAQSDVTLHTRTGQNADAQAGAAAVGTDEGRGGIEPETYAVMDDVHRQNTVPPPPDGPPLEQDPAPAAPTEQQQKIQQSSQEQVFTPDPRQTPITGS